MDPQIGEPLVLGFISVVLFVVLALRAKSTKPAPQRIEEWARRNAFRIVSAERRRFFIGPFFWLRSAGPGPFYRIVVRGQKGEVGEGWLCLHSSFGNDGGEVKWIRRPVHTAEPSTEAAPSPSIGKWAYGYGGFLALLLIVWGLASLVSGRFVIPSRQTHFVAEGPPAFMLAVALISFGLAILLHLCWYPYPKADQTSQGARVFGFVGLVWLILGLCFYFIEVAA